MILYIGNKLSRHGNTPTSVETLGKQLSEVYEVRTVSDKKNKILRMADMLWSIVKYRKKIDYILIDTYSTSNFYYAYLSALLAKGLGLKFIPILHGGNLPQRIVQSPKMSQTMFENAFMNVAPSLYLLDAFNKAGYASVYIPNNIEIVHYPFKKRTHFTPKLLYVRAFSRLYNPQLALEVLEKLLKKYPDASLCMVGPDRDGTLEKTKVQCKSMGLEAHVLFPGKLSKEAWWELSKEYDIFINTTHADNTPVSLIEAMALGLPIVSTDVGGIPYLVEDGTDGLLVPDDDAQAMYDKVETLLKNPEKTLTIAENARKKAESFDWENVKEKWVKLLEGVK